MRVWLSLVFVVLFAILAHAQAQRGPEFGHFVGKVSTDWDDDNIHFTLLQDFTYIDQKKRVWKANKGLRTDCASIPRFLWTVSGSPPCQGDYRKAAVVHDRYCINKMLATSDDVHEMFYNAMRAAGASKRQALVMYSAVYAAGPHWRKIKGPDGKEIIEEFRYYYPGARAFPPVPSAAEKALEAGSIEGAKAFVKQIGVPTSVEGLSPEQIERQQLPPQQAHDHDNRTLRKLYEGDGVGR